MPLCSYWGDGNVVGLARREWWSDVAVERGEYLYGKRSGPFLAVVYDPVDDSFAAICLAHLCPQFRC